MNDLNKKVSITASFIFKHEEVQEKINITHPMGCCSECLVKNHEIGFIPIPITCHNGIPVPGWCGVHKIIATPILV